MFRRAFVVCAPRISKHPIVLSVSRSRMRGVFPFLPFLPEHLSRRSSDSTRGAATPPATAI